MTSLVRPVPRWFALAACLSVAIPSAFAQFKLQLGPPPSKPLAAFSLPDWGTSAAFSPDGKSAAIGTYGKVQIIDVGAKKVARDIKVKSGFARGVAWSPDGTKMATGCFQAVEVWNAEGKSERSLKVKGYANDVKFSPDGKLLAAAVEAGVVKVWNVEDGSERLSLEAGKEPVWSVAFSANGESLAAAGGDDTRLSIPGFVKVWNVADGAESKAVDVVPEKCATDVAFSPDGKTLYVADMNDRVTVYELETGVARGYFGKHTRPVNSVVPMRDGLRVVSGSGGRFQEGNVVKFWTVADGKELATIEHHAGKVSRIALSPDESQLLTVSFDKTAALWDVAALLKPVPKSAPTSNAAPRVANDKTALQTLKIPAAFVADAPAKTAAAPAAVKRVGIIGLDTSHVIAFTGDLNRDPPTEAFAGFRVTAAYPQGSKDIESSTKRVPEYTEAVKKKGVKIVDSIDDLLKEVDYVLLESNDGRPHLEQALPVLKAKKPLFIDKPVAGSLADAIAIYEAARHYGTPVFTSSSLRYTKGAVKARAGGFGDIMSAESSSPCHLEATHPDFYWYGIHGVELLFTAMNTGCKSVTRTTSPELDVAIGTWKDGRTGTFRGLRPKGGYSLKLTTKNGVETAETGVSYNSLLEQIVEFFKSGKPPVSEEESLEIYAFMSAADESKAKNGAPVTLESVMTKARAEAKAKLADKLK